MANLVIDRMLCAGCSFPIRLRGFQWVHEGQPEAVERWCYPEAAAGTDRASVARPQVLDVVWVRYGSTGAESYHVMVAEVEYVLWRHRAEPGARPLWSAWRVDLPTPHLTLYYDTAAPEQGRSRVHDPRELTANMPALVGYWLMDKAEPF